jgi:aspartate kinase
MMQSTVAKFGGSSLATASGILRCLDLIRKHKYQAVIVSANGKITQNLDLLVLYHRQSNAHAFAQIWSKISTIYDEILTELAFDSIKTTRFIDILKALKAEFTTTDHSDAFRDRVLAYGEYLSAFILNELGTFHFVPAAQLIKTNSLFGAAEPNISAIKQNMDSLIQAHDFSVTPLLTQGFVGSDEQGHITTLGFEGSDFSAALVAEAMQVPALTIWTDVTGIYTVDPRYVPEATPIEKMSYAFAERISHYGARVLHPRTLEPLKRSGIPLWVQSSLDPGQSGTLISEHHEDQHPVITYHQSKVWLHHFDQVTLRLLADRFPLEIALETFPYSLASVACHSCESFEITLKKIHDGWCDLKKEKKHAL